MSPTDTQPIDRAALQSKWAQQGLPEGGKPTLCPARPAEGCVLHLVDVIDENGGSYSQVHCSVHRTAFRRRA